MGAPIIIVVVVVTVLQWRTTALSLSLCVEISEICLTCVGRLVARSTVKRNGQQLKCIVDAADALLQVPCASLG